MYALPEIKTILETYIATKQLVNSQDQAYINVAQDNVLLTSLVLNGPNAEFMKRDELLKRLLDKMQAWYGVKVEGRDPALQ
jgi:translation initiation factor 2D